jgi:diguanylate cyclase
VPPRLSGKTTHMSANDALTAPHGATPGPRLQLASDDWDILLAAILDRLRSIVRDRPGVNGASHPLGSSARRKEEVLECVAALESLLPSLALERGRSRQLERDLGGAQAELAEARGELAGTRDGERLARHLALHDSLTGLPNRRSFGEQLDQLLGRAEGQRTGLAILYLDLDDLKSINDQHGHDIGDELLRIAATRMRRGLRAQDMVSRLGGDEFACLLPDLLSREELSHLACKLFDTVSAPMQVGPCRLMIRPSIGITTCPSDGATAAALLKQADIAMYRAKRGQTGYAFFGDPFEEHLTRVARPTPELLRAMPAPPTHTPMSMTGSAPAGSSSA